ncbi:MAG: amidase family protein, partial [Haloarculaceae archaeon]
MATEYNGYVTRQVIEGAEEGPLAGVTVAVKDNISTAGVRTTCGSAMLEDYEPPYDATVVRRLKDAGATIPGKTNMDEFGMGTTTETSSFGPTDNPAAPGHVPGGSSGGSAAVVAAGDADLALGSDTGGSIRCPAAFCGVVGIKPTYGLVSRYGLVAYANSLEQIGPIAPSVVEAADLLSVIAGPDDRDATTREAGEELAAVEVAPEAEDPYDFGAAATGDVDGLEIGIPAELLDGADEAVVTTFRAAVADLEARGARTREVALPALEHAVQAYYVIAMSEASSNLARFDGVR